MNESKMSNNPSTSRAPASEPAPATRAAQETPVNALTERVGEVASSSLEQAQHLGTVAKERFFRGADERRESAARGLDDLARKIDGLANEAGGSPDDLQRRLAGSAARAVRSVSRTLSESSAQELIEAAGKKIKERPGIFLAGCVAVGFLGARLLRR